MISFAIYERHSRLILVVAKRECFSINAKCCSLAHQSRKLESSFAIAISPQSKSLLKLDFGLSPEETAIWFGILTLVVVEVGLITPPVGLNVFIINKMAKDVPIIDTFKGVIPFLLSDIIRIILLFSFPSITLIMLWAFY